MAIWRTTTYKERARGEVSPEEHFERDAATVTRTIDVLWGQRAKAVREFLGDSYVPTGLKYITRIVPNAYIGSDDVDGQYFVPDDVANTPFLYAYGAPDVRGIATRGKDAVTDVAQYEDARITLTYTSRKYDIRDDAWMLSNGFIDSVNRPDEAYLRRYVTKRYSPGIEALNYPANFFKYYGSGGIGGGQLPVAESPNILIPKINCVFTWEDVPSRGVPSSQINRGLGSLNSIENMIGTVNAQEYDANGNTVNTFGTPTTAGAIDGQTSGYAPGTLLFTGCEMEPWISPIGRFMYTIEYHFSFFPKGWMNLFSLSALAGPPSYDYYQVWTEPPAGPLTEWPLLAPGDSHGVPPADGVLLYRLRTLHDLFRPAIAG